MQILLRSSFLNELPGWQTPVRSSVILAQTAGTPLPGFSTHWLVKSATLDGA